MLEPHRTKRRELDAPREIEIRTGARLHFGLMNVRSPYGGAGMMIDQPVTRIRFESADRFQTSGPAKERVQAVAQRFATFLSLSALPACRITVLQRPDAHSGLGTGTQLALSVAQGLACWAGLALSENQIVRDIADRGHRSIVGSIGFYRGGLLVDQEPPRRHAVPEAWRIVLFRPDQAVSVSASRISGDDEQRKFSKLLPASSSQRRQLSELLDERMIPAVKAGDFDMFSEAVYRYNYHSGMLFAPVQQGPYNGKPVGDLIQILRDHDVRGVGQSSWGPTVFAFCQSADEAEELLSQAPFQAFHPQCVRPVNNGYQEASVAAP